MAGVFISYSTRDRTFVQRLYEALRAADTPVWLDLEGIAHTMSWQDEVRSAIDAAGAFIFVLSPDSIVSDWCRLELDAAFQLQKRIIPIVARTVPLNETPPRLAAIQRIDFTSAESFDAAVRYLVQVLGPAKARVGPVVPLAPRRLSLSPRAIARALILALIVMGGVIVRIFTPFLVPGGLFSLSPQYVVRLVELHPSTWLSVTAGSVMLNLVLASEVVVLWWRGRATRGEGAESQAPSGVIFISYTRSDSEFVDKLEKDLGEQGFKTWVDRRQLKGGQIWDATIVDALNRCQLALVVVSPDALNSGWVKKEYIYAAKRGKTLVPILFHPCSSIPRQLSRFQQLDFQAGLNFEAKYRYAFAELVAALDAIPLARTAQAAA